LGSNQDEAAVATKGGLQLFPGESKVGRGRAGDDGRCSCAISLREEAPVEDQRRPSIERSLPSTMPAGQPRGPVFSENAERLGISHGQPEPQAYCRD
ncbi:MAG: hypothetical protein ACK53L_17615, partial [Pirellulaceae bacterium]